ncbi:MAG: sodium-independent anion transporter, partial [Burkholderiales bacterium]|nr:sodium-independent anion transporter [Burkholderiales bacterium]
LLAVLHFLRRMAETVDAPLLDAREIRLALAADDVTAPVPDDVVVRSLEGPLFFAAVERIERALVPLPDAGPPPRRVVLRLRQVPFADLTGLQALQRVSRRLRLTGTTLVLCEPNPRVAAKLRNAGLVTPGVDAIACTATLAEAIGIAAVAPAAA